MFLLCTFRSLFSALKYRYQENADKHTDEPGQRAPFSSWRRSGTYEDVTGASNLPTSTDRDGRVAHGQNVQRSSSSRKHNDENSWKRDSYHEEGSRSSRPELRAASAASGSGDLSEPGSDELIYNFRQALRRHAFSENEKEREMEGRKADVQMSENFPHEEKSTQKKMERLRTARAKIEDQRKPRKSNSQNFATEFHPEPQYEHKPTSEDEQPLSPPYDEPKQKQSTKLARQKMVSDELKAKYMITRDADIENSHSREPDVKSGRQTHEKDAHYAEYSTLDKIAIESKHDERARFKQELESMPTMEEMLLGSTKHLAKYAKKSNIADHSAPFGSVYAPKTASTSSSTPKIEKDSEKMQKHKTEESYESAQVETTVPAPKHVSKSNSRSRKLKKYNRAKSFELGALSAEDRVEVEPTRDDSAIDANANMNDQENRVERIAKYKDERRKQLESIQKMFTGDAPEMPSLFSRTANEEGSPMSRSKSLKVEPDKRPVSPNVSRSKSLKVERDKIDVPADRNLASSPTMSTEMAKMTSLRLAELGSHSKVTDDIYDSSDPKYDSDTIKDKIKALRYLKICQNAKRDSTEEAFKRLSREADSENNSLERRPKSYAGRALLAERGMEQGYRGNELAPSRDRIRSSSKESDVQDGSRLAVSKYGYSDNIRDSGGNMSDSSEASSQPKYKYYSEKLGADKLAKFKESATSPAFEYGTVYEKKAKPVVMEEQVEYQEEPENIKQAAKESEKDLERSDSVNRVRRRLPSLEDVLGTNAVDRDQSETSKPEPRTNRQSKVDIPETQHQWKSKSAAEIRAKIKSPLDYAKMKFEEGERNSLQSPIELSTSFKGAKKSKSKGHKSGKQRPATIHAPATSMEEMLGVEPKYGQTLHPEYDADRITSESELSQSDMEVAQWSTQEYKPSQPVHRSATQSAERQIKTPTIMQPVTGPVPQRKTPRKQEQYIEARAAAFSEPSSKTNSLERKHRSDRNLSSPKIRLVKGELHQLAEQRFSKPNTVGNEAFAFGSIYGQNEQQTAESKSVKSKDMQRKAYTSESDVDESRERQMLNNKPNLTNTSSVEEYIESDPEERLSKASSLTTLKQLSIGSSSQKSFDSFASYASDKTFSPTSPKRESQFSFEKSPTPQYATSKLNESLPQTAEKTFTQQPEYEESEPVESQSHKTMKSFAEPAHYATSKINESHAQKAVKTFAEPIIMTSASLVSQSSREEDVVLSPTEVKALDSQNVSTTSVVKQGSLEGMRNEPQLIKQGSTERFREQTKSMTPDTTTSRLIKQFSSESSKEEPNYSPSRIVKQRSRDSMIEDESLHVESTSTSKMSKQYSSEDRSEEPGRTVDTTPAKLVKQQSKGKEEDGKTYDSPTLRLIQQMEEQDTGKTPQMVKQSSVEARREESAKTEATASSKLVKQVSSERMKDVQPTSDHSDLAEGPDAERKPVPERQISFTSLQLRSTSIEEVNEEETSGLSDVVSEQQTTSEWKHVAPPKPIKQQSLERKASFENKDVLPSLPKRQPSLEKKASFEYKPQTPTSPRKQPSFECVAQVPSELGQTDLTMEQINRIVNPPQAFTDEVDAETTEPTDAEREEKVKALTTKHIMQYTPLVDAKDEIERRFAKKEAKLKARKEAAEQELKASDDHKQEETDIAQEELQTSKPKVDEIKLHDEYQQAKIKMAEEKIKEERMKIEQERINAEQERVKAEQERVKAEEERAKAEQDRAFAEKELAKAKQEQVRVEHECAKAELERLKAENEILKAQQELAKVEQEKLRLQTVAKTEAATFHPQVKEGAHSQKPTSKLEKRISQEDHAKVEQDIQIIKTVATSETKVEDKKVPPEPEVKTRNEAVKQSQSQRVTPKLDERKIKQDSAKVDQEQTTIKTASKTETKVDRKQPLPSLTEVRKSQIQSSKGSSIFDKFNQGGDAPFELNVSRVQSKPTPKVAKTESKESNQQYVPATDAKVSVPEVKEHAKQPVQNTESKKDANQIKEQAKQQVQKTGTRKDANQTKVEAKQQVQKTEPKKDANQTKEQDKQPVQKTEAKKLIEVKDTAKQSAQKTELKKVVVEKKATTKQPVPKADLKKVPVENKEISKPQVKKTDTNIVESKQTIQLSKQTDQEGKQSTQQSKQTIQLSKQTDQEGKQSIQQSKQTIQLSKQTDQEGKQSIQQSKQTIQLSKQTDHQNKQSIQQSKQTVQTIKAADAKKVVIETKETSKQSVSNIDSKKMKEDKIASKTSEVRRIEKVAEAKIEPPQQKDLKKVERKKTSDISKTEVIETRLQTIKTKRSGPLAKAEERNIKEEIKLKAVSRFDSFDESAKPEKSKFQIMREKVAQQVLVKPTPIEPIDPEEFEKGKMVKPPTVEKSVTQQKIVTQNVVEKRIVGKSKSASKSKSKVSDTSLDDILSKNVDYLTDAEPIEPSRGRSDRKLSRPQSIHEHQSKTKRSLKKKVCSRRSKSEDRSRFKVSDDSDN